jgi:hypothetical protein
MAKECKPSRYAVVDAKGNITYGFRCAKHGIATKRYSTRELCEKRLAEHKKSAKES